MAELNEDKVFNFGVYKYTKIPGTPVLRSARRILQFDFDSKKLCNIQKGNRNRKFDFDEIEGCEAEDDLRFYIHFGDHVGHPYECDADSLEDKNEICRLVNLIVSGKKGEGEEFTNSDFVVDRSLIKEGLLEKKGHGVSSLSWPERFMRIQKGELSYFRPDERDTALNLIPLDISLVSFSKVDNNIFTVRDSKKQWSFRVPAGNLSDREIEMERDEWFDALINSSHVQRRGAAAGGSVSSRVMTMVLRLQQQVKEVQNELANGGDAGVASAKLASIGNAIDSLNTTISVTVNDEDNRGSAIESPAAVTPAPATSAPPPPPPSEPSGGGGPPPPPPPPPPPGGGPPPPPPPPGMGGAAPDMGPVLPEKLDVIPNVKLRPLFWTKIPDREVPKTFWMTAKEPSTIDSTLLDELFGVTESVKVQPVKKERKEDKTLMNFKTNQNVGIFLSQFKVPHSEINSRLNSLSFSDADGGLSLDSLIGLKRVAPTAEQIETLKGYTESPNSLARTDQFLILLAQVPKLNSRLNLLSTVHELPERFREVEPELIRMLKVVKNLNKSRNFHRVLEHVLSFGNYINGGTSRGKAHGFKLNTLVKLADYRGQGSNKKVTLVDYCVLTFKKLHPELAKFTEEFADDLNECRSASVKGMSAEVQIIKKDLTGVRKTMETLMKVQENGDKPCVNSNQFKLQLEAFLGDYEKKMDRLQTTQEDLKTSYDQLLKMFGEKPGTNSEELFMNLHVFVERFHKAYLDSLPKPKVVKVENPPARKSADEKAPEVVKGATVQNSNSWRESKRLSCSPAIGSGGRLSRDELPVSSIPLNGNSSTKSLTGNLGVVKSGWLAKRSGGTKWRTKFDKRWFELDEGFLHYYKKEGTKALGSITIPGTPILYDPRNPKTIQVETPERTYIILASSEGEAIEWKEVLLEVGGIE